MNIPLIDGSGTMLRLVPRTSSSRTSCTATGCAKVSVNARLSRSADNARSLICVSGSKGGNCAGRCAGEAREKSDQRAVGRSDWIGLTLLQDVGRGCAAAQHPETTADVSGGNDRQRREDAHDEGAYHNWLNSSRSTHGQDA